MFSVIIENPGGQAKCSANLIVEEKAAANNRMSKSFNPPSFTKTIDDKKIKVGTQLKLECLLSATKPIDVHWIKVEFIWFYLKRKLVSIWLCLGRD